MKRILIIIAACTFGFASFAQDEYEEVARPSKASKGNSEYLPSAGDIAVGLDGTPFFDYIGNMFNGSAFNSLNLGDNTLYFRYYLTNTTAARLSVSFYSKHDVSKGYVSDDAALFVDPTSNAQLIDRANYLTNGFKASAGYQINRSYKRLNGYVGADIGYSIHKEKVTYEYGNQMNQLNPTPSTDIWGNAAVRPLVTNRNGFQSFFLGAFIGAEYFFLPKVSIGGEFGVVSGLSFFDQENATIETMVVTQHVEQDIAVAPRKTEGFVSTLFPYPYYGGSLYFLVHF